MLRGARVPARRAGVRSAPAILFLTLIAPLAARAEFPYPTNPRPCAPVDPAPDCILAADFSEYLFLPTTDPPTLPNDYPGDPWKLTSTKTGNATIDSSAQELFGVRGASVDLAWQVTTGRPDVLVAVLDSGIRWQDPLPDLVNKFYLNAGELPPPQGSSQHDRNGDGVFNLRDYLADATHAQDTRVVDMNENGFIDPEDLIFVFSDAVDQDGNGYIDDISGWDFFEDDNDALDEVRYGHGTGESHDSGAETNNGTGDVGVCPNCLILEVRVGDSFVAEVNAFAQGVAFAVDSGARVIQEALGTINQTRFGQAAVDYAYENGAVVIASAADEESNHHNYPANYNHTVEVNSVTRFGQIGPLTQSPPSYLYLNGCTNYGGHIALAVASSSCSSEATGLGSGMAALVISAAENAVDRGELTPYPRDDGSLASFALSAEEVKQILTATADDINFDARDDVDPPLPQNYTTTIAIPGIQGSERFRSIAGWDQFFGYGRMNADRAVRRVAPNLIPPEAAIDAPAWFATVDPEATLQLEIRGRVAANRASSFGYVIEIAPGIQPAEEDFLVERQSSVPLTQAIDGVLGSIDVAALRERMPNGVEGPATLPDGSPDPDRFSFTVRVRVTDDLGNVGEDRRVLALHHDPDLLEGFPRELGSDGVSAPLTADIDGDTREEIIIGTSNGLVHAFNAEGTEVTGWPVATDPLELHLGAPAFSTNAIAAPVFSSIVGAVAVGDLDRDGTLEVVATDLQGKAYAWNRNGERLPGFPVSTRPEYSFTRRSERDLDTIEGRTPDRVNRHDEHNRLSRALAAGPVLANLDGSEDGSLEILSGSFDRHLYAWHDDGTPVRGWPVLLKDPAKVEFVDPNTNEVSLIAGARAQIGTKVLVPPSVGDLDGDGDLEVVAVVNEEYVEDPNAVFTNPIINIFRAAGVLEMGNTRIYALHDDGAAHGDEGIDRGWNPDAFLPGWPVRTVLMTTELLPVVGTGSNGPPALADIDGDGRLEIGTMSVVGPPYVLTLDGESFFGDHPTGELVTLAIEPNGDDSTAVDTPTVGSLGGVVLAELAGPGQGFHLLAPTAGLGKLVDAQAPARQFPAENHLTAWRVTNPDGTPADGAILDGFPRVVNDLQFLATPALADINGDGLPEAMQGSGVYDLHAVDVNGVEPDGWPKFTNGWMIGGPAVGDVDGDGLLEVVAATREGNLFVWKTAGDECGDIPWRRWHHDEWGTGNYHTDARPPASIPVVNPFIVTATTARIRLSLMPGDDLFCGDADRFEVRFSADPIGNEAEFAAATEVASATGTAGGRQAGEIRLEDERFAGSSFHFAVVIHDDAGNRSALISLGSADFPVAPTPTNTATPTGVPTFTASATVTATASPTATGTDPLTPTPTPTLDLSTTTPSSTPTPTPDHPPATSTTVPATATSTRAPSATATNTAVSSPTHSVTASPTRHGDPGFDDDSGGCSIAYGPATSGPTPLLLGALALLAIRRRSQR